MGKLSLNFWKEYKWLQVCQLLLLPSVTEYSTVQGNGGWLGTVCAAWWGTVLPFVSSSYFHGKTVFSCNFTSTLAELPYICFSFLKKKQKFRIFCIVPEKFWQQLQEKKKWQLSNPMLHQIQCCIWACGFTFHSSNQLCGYWAWRTGPRTGPTRFKGRIL